MKRYYPLFAAVLFVGGILAYIISGKSSTTSATASKSATDKSTFMGSTPLPIVSGSKLTDGTHTGAVVSTDYGDIQVAIVASGGKITAVNVLQQPGAEQRSLEINADAIPKLKAEVLTAQSSQVRAISGASFTSDGFNKTLASAFTS